VDRWEENAQETGICQSAFTCATTRFISSKNLAGGTFLGKTYPEALTALAARLQSEAPTNTIDQLISKYEVDELPKRAAKTQAGRRQQFKKLREVFGTMRPSDIEPHHVWTYWKERGEIEQARKEISALSAVLTFARRYGALKTPNPCFGLQLPNTKPRNRYVNDEEFLRVRAIAQPMIAYAMDLAYLAGMDEGTIRKLERRNITDEGLLFERGKTGAWQLIEWNDDLRRTVQAILRERPQLRRALICNRKGEAYSANGFQAQWQRTVKNAVKAGISRFHFHDIRAKSGSDSDSDQEASDRLGHADVTLTKRVYRRKPRRATALNILDNTADIGQTRK
jgi:integrase